MGYALRTGVTFCRVAGTTVLLDSDADRYVGLTGNADAAFDRLTSATPQLPDDAAALGGLVAKGLLIPQTGGDVPRPCAPLDVPRASLLDQERQRTSPAETIAMVARLFMADRAIAWRRFGATLDRLERRIERHPEHPDAGPRLERLVDALERCRLISASLDRCLPRSIAVAHRMLDRGIAPIVVLGVRTRPFAAHCWVQTRHLLVNDRYDQVRTFTPIRVIR